MEEEKNKIETCPLEDWLVYNHKTMPIFAIIHGGVQKGKSTLFYTLANNITILEAKEEWDYKKYCARNLPELIEMVRKYDNAVLGYEETTRELSTVKWYSDFNTLCAEMLETQGYKKNIIFFVQPVGMTIPNRQRRMINIGLEVLQKDERRKSVMWRNTVYEFQNWRLDESFIWYNHLLGINVMTYTHGQLTRAKEFTNWLIEAKKVIMDSIVERSQMLNSINFNKKEVEIPQIKVKINNLDEQLIMG